MASLVLTLRVRTAWWLPLYIHTIKWFYVLTGWEPDWDAVERVVLNGMKLKANNQVPPFPCPPSPAPNPFPQADPDSKTKPPGRAIGWP